jgi:hypothetical protein
MNARLEELLTRLIAKGPFPGISASEGCELVQLVHDLNKATVSPAPSGQAELDLLSAKICMTCKHWADENERALQVKACKANPKCMDKKYGWPCAGDCNNTVANGIELYIDGNATANLEYDANFGCNNWESI